MLNEESPLCVCTGQDSNEVQTMHTIAMDVVKYVALCFGAACSFSTCFRIPGVSYIATAGFVRRFRCQAALYVSLCIIVLYLSCCSGTVALARSTDAGLTLPR
jgi:hypothetical protein